MKRVLSILALFVTVATQPVLANVDKGWWDVAVFESFPYENAGDHFLIMTKEFPTTVMPSTTKEDCQRWSYHQVRRLGSKKVFDALCAGNDRHGYKAYLLIKPRS